MRVFQLGRSIRAGLGAAVLALCGFAAPVLAVPLAGLQGGTTLVFFDSASPSVIIATRTITGLQAGETIVGIDRRPNGGGLYGLGSTGRIYLINPNNGNTLQIGTGALTLIGTAFGIDFNPTVDRIRIVSDTGQNLRANPDTGALAATDSNLNGGATGAVGAAYTNNFAGAVTTTLFDINHTTDALYIQSPPNAGTLVLVGALGVDTSASVGFDITATGQAFAVLNVGGVSSLYSINTTTGAATLVGAVPGGALGGLTAVSGFPVGGVPTNVPTLSVAALAMLMGLFALVAAFIFRRRAVRLN